MSKKVTIYDIARYLHVTPATVSYSLNNVSKVSEETRKKVLAAAKELGYSRDYTATSLSTGKTHLMALFLPFEDISRAFLENPYYGEFIGGFVKQIKKYDYDLLVQSMMDEKEILPWLRGRGVDAIAVIGGYPKHFRKAFNTFGKPVVLIDTFDDNCEEYNNVRISDYDGSYLATEYLIKQGHRHIAFISGDINTSIVDKKRYEGYKEALEDNGVPFDKDVTYICEISLDEGLKYSNVIMSKKDVTAVVCAADTLAIGIINGYRNAGKSIPEDLSVVGFDDIVSAKFTVPALTTVKQDIVEKGRLAAKLLLDDLRNKEINHKIITLNPELIIRNSVKHI